MVLRPLLLQGRPYPEELVGRQHSRFYTQPTNGIPIRDLVQAPDKFLPTARRVGLHFLRGACRSTRSYRYGLLLAILLPSRLASYHQPPCHALYIAQLVHEGAIPPARDLAACLAVRQSTFEGHSRGSSCRRTVRKFF